MFYFLVSFKNPKLWNKSCSFQACLPSGLFIAYISKKKKKKERNLSVNTAPHTTHNSLGILNPWKSKSIKIIDRENVAYTYSRILVRKDWNLTTNNSMNDLEDIILEEIRQVHAILLTCRIYSCVESCKRLRGPPPLFVSGDPWWQVVKRLGMKNCGQSPLSPCLLPCGHG